MNLQDRITEAERLRRNNRALRNGDARQEWQVRLENSYKAGWKPTTSDLARDVIWAVLYSGAVLALLCVAIQWVLN